MQSAARFIPLLFGCCLAHGQVNILTANGSNDRTNSNLQETQLSSTTVSPSTFGKLGMFPVDGQVYAQPLYVSGLAISGGIHNIVFVTTMHNSVYAFDADAMSPVFKLWQVNLGASVPAGFLLGQYADIANEVGILSTGVIDLQRGVIYVVADVMVGARALFFLHALDLATGQERMNGPVVLAAAVSGTGSGSLENGTLPFDSMQHIQRPGLLLSNNAVFISFGSHGDQSPYHGWMLSYDAADLTHQLGVYNTTPNGDGGALWQSGRGPAADAQGNIYAITGNGDYDGAQNFGESFIRLSPDGTAVTDSFTPSDWKSLSDNDFDISAGPALVPGTRLVIGADKGGTLYVINGDAMRQGTGATVLAASTGSIFNFAVWSRGGGIASVYVQGGREPLKCFQITGGNIGADPVSIAANPVPFSRIGITVSANGGTEGSGILWETTGDYNNGTPGTLHAYDASNLANELWNSDMNGDRDQMPLITKFVPPTVANGRVYVPGLSNVVMVYGLFVPIGNGVAGPSIATVSNAASYAVDAVSPGDVVTIMGANLGPVVPEGAQLDGSGAVANRLSDTQVLFDGVASPLLYASAGQINAVVPFGVSGTTTQVQVQFQGQASDPFPVSVTATTLGIFSADASGSGQAILLNQDGSLNSPDNPAPAGSVVTFWATGAGLLSPPLPDGTVVSADNLPLPVVPVLAQVGTSTAQVLYAGGAPGMVAGVIQVNLRIPRSSQTGAAVPLVLRSGDSTSQSGITLAVRP